MKKVNFFKVMSAAMAFAAVTFTACSEEEMKIDTPDVEIEAQPLPNALATLSISVYDVNTMSLLTTVSKDVTASMGKKETVECPSEFKNSDKYVIASNTEVEIPQLVAGQVAIIPVSFYLGTIEDAWNEIADILNDDTNAKIEKEQVAVESDNLEKENPTAYDITGKFSFTAYTPGEEIYVGSKAATTAADIVAENYKSEFSTKKYEFPYTLWAYHFVKYDVEQTILTKTFEFEFNGAKETIVINEAGTIIATVAEQGIIEKYLHEWNHGHTHSHGHGHGHGADNAGGGIVWAE